MEIRWVNFQNYTISQDVCNQEETDNLNRSINSSDTKFVIKNTSQQTQVQDQTGLQGNCTKHL